MATLHMIELYIYVYIKLASNINANIGSKFYL